MADTGSGASGKTEPRVTVCLFHDHEAPYLTNRATTLFDDGDHIVVRAPWAEPAERDVGYVRFQHQDVWTEHYWRSRLVCDQGDTGQGRTAQGVVLRRRASGESRG